MPQGWLCVSLWMHDRMDFVRVEHAKTAIKRKVLYFEDELFYDAVYKGQLDSVYCPTLSAED